jgi:hypothetical protein
MAIFNRDHYWHRAAQSVAERGLRQPRDLVVAAVECLRRQAQSAHAAAVGLAGARTAADNAAARHTTHSVPRRLCAVRVPVRVPVRACVPCVRTSISCAGPALHCTALRMVWRSAACCCASLPASAEVSVSACVADRCMRHGCPVACRTRSSFAPSPLRGSNVSFPSSGLCGELLGMHGMAVL